MYKVVLLFIFIIFSNAFLKAQGNYVIEYTTGMLGPACDAKGFTYNIDVGGSSFSYSSSETFSDYYVFNSFPISINSDMFCTGDYADCQEMAVFSRYTNGIIQHNKTVFEYCEMGAEGSGDDKDGFIYATVIPLLNLELKSSAERIVCGNDPIVFDVSAKDPSWTNPCLTNGTGLADSSHYFNARLEYQIVGESGWTTLTNKSIYPGEHQIYYSTINNPQILGKELIFRVKQSFNGDRSGSYTYTSPSKNGIYYLQRPNFTVNFNEPVCYNDETSITINNLPENASTASLRVDLQKLTTNSNNSADNHIVKLAGDPTEYYIYDSAIKIFTKQNSQNSVTISSSDFEGNNFKLTNGIYLAKAFFYTDENNAAGSSLCSDTASVTIYTDTLKLNLNSPPKIGDTSNNIGAHRGTCKLSGGVEGEQGSYTLKYEKNGGSETSFTFNATNFSEGTYNFWVTDSKGCKSPVIENVKLSAPDQLKATVSKTDPNCHSNNTSDDALKTGLISVEVTEGGIKPYKAILYNSADTEIESIEIAQPDIPKDFGKVAPGTYTVKIFNNQTHKAFEVEKTITSPSELKIDKVTIDDVSCYGGSNGQATVEVTGGTASYTFGISADDITDDSVISSLSASDYIFHVKDSKKCTAKSESKTISEPPSRLTITPKNEKAETCNAKDGTVQFDIAGGWAGEYPYVITIDSNPVKTITVSSGSLVGVKATGLSNGTYNVEVKNAKGCIANNTFTIGETNPLTVKASVGSMPNCSGKEDGSIVLTIGGGSSAASYSLDDFASSFTSITTTINNLRDGTYNYSIKDERGCVASTGDFQLNVRQDPVIFDGKAQMVEASCPEIVKGDGSIIAKGFGGKGTYDFSLSGLESNTTGSFDNLLPDTYTLTISDEAGCSHDTTIVLGASSVHPISSLLVESYHDQYCTDGNKGEITVSGSYSGNSANTLDYSISPGAQTKAFTAAAVTFGDLEANHYTVQLKDSRGCYKTIEKTINNKNYTPQVEINTLTDLACSTAQNGKLEIKVTDYSGDDAGQGFTYSFEDADNKKLVPSLSSILVNNYSQLTNQVYGLTVTDAFNCEYKASNIKLNLLPDAVKLTDPIITKPTCKDAHNGSIELSAIDGVWKPGNIYDFYLIDNTDASLNQHVTGPSAIFNGLYPNHNYNLKVEDAEGCTDEKALGMIGHLPLISISEPIKTAPLCYQDENGAIDVAIGNIYEARVNYTYELFKADAGNNDQSLQSFTDKTESYNKLGDGRYMLKVSGDDNCVTSYPGIDIVEPQPILVDNRQYSCISTHGQKTGWFGIDFSLGSLNYVIEWIKADGTKETQTVNLAAVGDVYHFKREDLGPGDYTFRLKDKNECDYFDGGIWYETSVTITEPEPLEISFSKVDESCTDYSDGQIVISASGGWLCPATEHTDCQNPAHDNCPEWQTNTCGTQDYLYSIDATKSEWQCEPVFQSLTPGNYDISVMDKAGNITTTSVEILARPKLSIQPIDAFPASCPGYDNGRIAATIDNGVFITDHLDYTIRETVSGDLVIAKEDDRDYHYGKLFAGTYTLQVTDLNGCFDAQDFTIGEPEVPEISITHNYIRKKGEATGEIDVEVVKGNGVFNYEWYKDAEAIAFENGQTIKDISLRDLLVGTYTLKIQDTAECVYEVSDWMERQVQIIEPELPLSFTVKENSPVTCNGLSDGILEVTPIGGWGDYTYAINGEPEQASPRYEGRPAGNYTITVKDSAGITWQNIIELAQPEVLTASFRAKQDVRCFDGSDGSIELAINGGNLSYQVSVDNAQWYDGTTVPDLPIGTYTVYVQDPKNCLTQVDNITLNQPTEIQLLDSTIIKSRCSNNEGQIFSSYTGGVDAYTYKWQKGIGDDIVELPYVTADITDLYSGLYTIEVRDAHDCPMLFNFPVGDITDLAIESIAVTDVSCWDYSDGEVQATVVRGNPAYTYTWSEEITASDQNKAWGMKAGTYYLMVTDEKKCNAVREFTVGTPDSLYYNIVDMEHPLCLGGEQGHIEIQGTGGTPAYEYQWSTGSTESQLSDVVPGDYVLGITDAHNCHSEFTIPFDYQRIVVPFIGNDTLICHYDALPLDAGQYEQFKWTSLNGFRAKEQQVVVTEPDTYYLEVTDADKCLGYDTLKLDVSDLQITNLSVKDVTCNGFADGEAHVVVSPATWPHTIQWTDDSYENTWLNLSGGNYSVRVFDEYGCEDKRDFSVNEPDALALNVNKLMQPLCFGVPDGRIELEAIGGVGNYRYEWLHQATKSTINKLDTGIYVVDLYDANNCHLRESYEMTYVRTIYPKLGDDLTVCEGNNAKLYPGEFYSYQWFKNDVEVGTDTALIVSESDTYWVEVQDEDNCIGRDTMTLSTYATDVAPEFLTATSVAAGDTLIIVEVTQPKPQHIDWSFTGEYNIVEQGAYFCKVIFTEQGMREITLNAHMNDCFAQARKTILVTPPGTGSSGGDDMADKAYQNLLKLGVSPNPTDGFFTVSIELSEKAPVNVYLVSLGTGQILEQRVREGMDIYSETFSLSIPGMYVVVVESNGEKRVAKVIVN